MMHNIGIHIEVYSQYVFVIYMIYLYCVDDVNLLTKKKVFDKVMLIQRLEEEQTIVVQEAKQHWLYLRSQEHKLNSLLDTIISGGKNLIFFYTMCS